MLHMRVRHAGFRRYNFTWYALNSKPLTHPPPCVFRRTVFPANTNKFLNLCASSKSVVLYMPKAKRHLSDNAELAVLRGQLISKIASLLERTEEEIAAAVAAAPSATIIELGLTSAMGIALKGWCFKTLEAELTTFELLKLPFDDVVLALEAARRQDIGARLPSLDGAAPAPAHESDHLSMLVAAAGAPPAP